MFTYDALYKPNQIIKGNGQIAIVTGWTPKDKIAKRLNPAHYAAIGNLYSPARGINFLIRNLLANPHVTHLVIYGVTKEDKNAGGCECLHDFFFFPSSDGVSYVVKGWQITSAVTGYIDEEVDLSPMMELRNYLKVKYFDTPNIEGLVEYIESEGSKQHKWERERYTFPDPIVKTTVFPADVYGQRVQGKTIAEAWLKLLQRIRLHGIIRPTGYDGQWQELINLVVVVTDEPEGFYLPEYLPCDQKSIAEYLPQVLEDAPYAEGVKYTYGQRLRSWFGCDQVEQVIEKLIKEVDAASAVMNLWDSGSASTARFGRKAGDSDHDHGGSPCLNHIWVRITDGELSLTATFRSNDMFSAWASNAAGLRALQIHILEEIKKRSLGAISPRLGRLITISQSAHIYDDCFENADKTISEHLKPTVTYDDPVGNFLVEWKDKSLLVTHLSPRGEVLQTFNDKNPLVLVRQIGFRLPTITPVHLGYLGIELQRAAIAKGNYEQDKRIKT